MSSCLTSMEIKAAMHTLKLADDGNCDNAIHSARSTHPKTVLGNVLHMNPGHEDFSYAKNSTTQKSVMSKVRPILEGRVKSMLGNKAFSKHFVVADLGCSSGPNALVAASVIVEAMAEFGHQIRGGPLGLGLAPPTEILVFLNDLPGNDFNSLFTSPLPPFYEKLNKKLLAEGRQSVTPKCYVSAMPGTFFGRLFPSKSLHFVHSSYSLHWLSQVPEGLNNKGNVFMASTSPPSVFRVYLKQFQRDFTTFLSSRADETVGGGEMLLILQGRTSASYSTKETCLLWELFSKSLLEMAHEGLVKEAEIDSFNLPLFKPSEEEVRDLVRLEGSFIINMVESLEINWDPFDDDHEDNKEKSGQNVARSIRAVSEPLVTAHFGRGLSMDDLFGRFAIHVGEHLALEKTKIVNLVISMTRRDE